MPRKQPAKSNREAVSPKLRADDDKLREQLRTTDLKKFERELRRAVFPKPQSKYLN